MALSQTAFQRDNTRKPAARTPQTVIREMTYQLDYLGVTEKREAAYEDRDKPADQQKMVDRIEFKFAVVLPGADAAQAALEAMEPGEDRELAQAAFNKKFRDKGHGRFFWITCNQSMSRGGNGKKASNAYLVIRGLLNEGNDLTDEQMRNATALVNALESENPRPQFFGYISADNGKNKLMKIAGRVPEDERLPSWRQMERLADPREATLDDPTIVCSETGVRLYGFPVERDGAEVWYSNKEFAAMQVEKYGKVLSNELHRKRVREGRKAEAQTAAANGEEKMPF